MPKIIEDRERSPLGKNILERRLVLEMTQTKLAEACGLRQSRIAEIETGFSKDPPVGTVERIAEALDTTVDGLIHGIHPKRRRSNAS